MWALIIILFSSFMLSCSSDNTDYSPMIAPIDQRAVKEKEEYLRSKKTQDSLSKEITADTIIESNH